MEGSCRGCCSRYRPCCSECAVRFTTAVPAAFASATSDIKSDQRMEQLDCTSAYRDDRLSAYSKWRTRLFTTASTLTPVAPACNVVTCHGTYRLDTITQRMTKNSYHNYLMSLLFLILKHRILKHIGALMLKVKRAVFH